MLFGLKNRPFVSTTFHLSSRGFEPEANVAVIGQPKMAYLDVEKNHKIKVLNRFDSCYVMLPGYRALHFVVFCSDKL